MNPAPGLSPPPALPGFEHVKRFWDTQESQFIARVLPGEYYVTRNPELITTVLGSCVAVCARDPVARVGGMNHFMLPDGSCPDWSQPDTATRYGSYAMEHLLNELFKQGGQRNRLEIKIFGGGRVLNAMTDVGARNIAFIKEFLQNEGYRIAAADVGDVHPRKVLYTPDSGRVRVKKLQTNSALVQQETQYMKQIAKKPLEGDIELFD